MISSLTKNGIPFYNDKDVINIKSDIEKLAKTIGNNFIQYIGNFKRDNSINLNLGLNAINFDNYNIINNNLCEYIDNGCKIKIKGQYMIVETIRIKDIANRLEWYSGISINGGHKDDEEGGSWNATYNRHKITTTIIYKFNENDIIKPNIYLINKTAELERLNFNIFKLNDKIINEVKI